MCFSLRIHDRICLFSPTTRAAHSHIVDNESCFYVLWIPPLFLDFWTLETEVLFGHFFINKGPTPNFCLSLTFEFPNFFKMICELLRGLFVLLPWSLDHFLLPEKTEKIVQKPKNLPPKLPLFGKSNPPPLPHTMSNHDQEQTWKLRSCLHFFLGPHQAIFLIPPLEKDRIFQDNKEKTSFYIECASHSEHMTVSAYLARLAG